MDDMHFENGLDEIRGDDVCICSHLAEDHHRSWFRNGGQLIEECEFYGHNETGGMEYVDGKWIEHCQRFRSALTRGNT